MSIDLTRVFDLNRNIFIEACAGAGKTWLLSKRYAVIMDDFARQVAEQPQTHLHDAGNILVITFTRKAAAEMSGRIYEDLNKLLNGETLRDVPPDLGSHLRSAPAAVKMHFRSTFSRNAISTIDAFCAQILREQAEVLGLDPEFRIQDEADTQRMELETWEHYLAEQSRCKNQDLAILLENLSIRQISEYVSKFQGKAQLLESWLEQKSTTSPEALEDAFKLKHPLPDELSVLEREMSALVIDLPSSEDMLNPEHALYRGLLKIQTLTSSPLSDPYIQGQELLECIRDIFLIKDRSKYTSRITIDKGVWPESFTETLRSRLKAFKDLAETLLPIETLMLDIPSIWDLKACTVHHHLSRFFLGYWEALNTRLKREGILSFNEVMRRTRALLQDPGLAAIYAQRYPHILFDEFQDTNDVRWDIIRLIAEGGEGVLRQRGLFIVGDTKQSIYRFNQADVQVMNRVRKLITTSGGWSLTADETYRSTQTYVDSVINPLITKTFPGTEEADDIQLYETVFRPTSTAKALLESDDYQEISRCTVDVILDDSQIRGAASTEIYRLADLTLEWLDWIKTHELEPKQGPSIGILLRSFSNILDYIRIFTSRGIPFEVLASQGLFKQQESFDLYHLISVLINPLDDLALVGILRSPIFIMKDADIQRIREEVGPSSRSGWVWRGLQTCYPEITETLRLWQQASAREPLDRLVETILSEDDRRISYMSETGGALRLANLERLIFRIHQLSLDGLSLREIQEYFKYQIQHGDASQAELPGSAQVQILTIHKSKGLEFPVVLLPGMHAPPPPETSGMFIDRFHGEWEVGLTLETPRASQKTWLFERIKACTKAEEEAEDRRLFYVGVTRARYGIGFTASIKPSIKANSGSRWARFIEPVLDVAIDKDLAQNDPEVLAKEWQTRSAGGIEYKLSSATDLLAREDLESQPRVAKLVDLEPVMPDRVYQEISPHTIMSWMDTRQLKGSDERIRGDDLGLETSALTFGRLLHKAMEMEWVDLEVHEPEIRLFLEEENVLETEIQEVFLTDLRECLSLYENSELAKRLSRLPPGSRLPELPVFGYLENERHVYKVTGIIDLLFEEDGKWVVLDYKSDKELPSPNELQQHPYWYQIQTYLWMLRMLYGIRATGLLYFNRFDQLIPIPVDEERYFKMLAKRISGGQVRATRPGVLALDPVLEQHLKQSDRSTGTLIIEPTRNSAEALSLSLAEAGLNFPRLRIMTLGEVRKSTEPTGRRLTPYLTRLGIAQLSGRRLQWGVVNRLAEAFYKAMGGDQVVESKLDLFKRFLVWCQEHGIQPPGQQSDLTALANIDDVIIHSIHSTAPSDYDFLRTLAGAIQVRFKDPLEPGKLSPGFSMSIRDWMKQKDMPEAPGKHHYTSCFSVREEAVLAGAEIRKLVAEGVDPGLIRIAVSSMERYVPSLLKVFGEQGISTRLSKREPVMERPVTQLAFALIRGRMRTQLSWDQAMSVWLNPLVMPSGSDGYARMKLDVEVRKLGVTVADDHLVELLRGTGLEGTMEDLLDFIKGSWQIGQKTSLIGAADWLIELLGGFQFANRLEPGSVAAKAYTSLKNAILGIRNDWERYLSRQGSISDLNRELKERLKSVEVASSQQGFGIDVISYLDTLNLNSGHLFVLGFTEGQFPVSLDTNPYLKPPVLNPWYLNLYLFKHWLDFPKGHLHITAPRYSSDGSALQESTFCEYLEATTYPKLEQLTREQQFPYLGGRRFDPALTPRESRHNQLLNADVAGDWKGRLAPHEKRNFTQLSASAFDELVKCPQRYWYGRKLNLESAETDIAAREEIEVGNLVHKVLERFGKDDGFLLARTDLEAAFEKLESISATLLTEKGVDLDADLLHNKWGERYFRNFRDPELNLISALIKHEQDILEAFNDAGLHEQSFGDPTDEKSWDAFELEDSSIKLSLQGKIDRVMVSDKYVWATDYKTGNVDIKDSKEFWTSQMLFYYLVLRSRFPDHDVVLTYEQVKSFKDGVGMKGFIGDLVSEHPAMGGIQGKSRPFQPIGEEEDWTVERIHSQILEYAIPLRENSFPLTTRDVKKACAFCPFERICRLSAYPG